MENKERFMKDSYMIKYFKELQRFFSFGRKSRLDFMADLAYN